MTAALRLSPSAAALFRDGLRFVPWSLDWVPVDTIPDDLREVTPTEAVGWAFREGGARRLPVGVIGPREASPAQLGTAEAVGRRLGELGIPLVCGGRGGVMEAACRGAAGVGGLTIGLLPEAEWTSANSYVAIPLATGLNEVRNTVIARSAAALIAVGGSPGTLTEIAFGVHFGRPVLLLEDAFPIPGARTCVDIAEAIDGAARALLRLPPV
jgi:uncharacterized protein (TIGR00725 family)